MADAVVIGAGLAGCEAAWALANAGHRVTLYEMKPAKYSPAHHNPGFAELICSNSFKATRHTSAAGLLKEEMALLGSVVLEAAGEAAVSAGGALAVDRELFSAAVTRRITRHPGITVVTGEEVTQIPEGDAVIATGPLTSQAFSDAIGELCGEKYLSFYDASAPIVTLESVNQEKTFFATRYDRGEADYINCPFTQPEYDAFYDALVSAQTVELKPFEREYFKVYEGCMPIEVMAKRGRDTLRFGPMRPVGIKVPWTGHRPWANIQLRKDNADGSLYNIVGFQTNLTFPEQQRVFRMIPGLKEAQFMRYGVMHRNTFLDSPRLLDSRFRLRKMDNLYFAGQITGVEGYIESAASGIVAGRSLARRLSGKEARPLPRDTMLGSLCAYISDPEVTDFQPMGSNMGILPPLEVHERNKELRYTKMADRAVASLRRYLQEED
jgi:methylenetetrahydrofolate--tRNA-(uracil-5-)-methyltransferase